MAMRASQVARLEVATETLQMGEGPDIGFLHDVLGLAVVAQDAAGDPVEPAIVRLHDRANGAFLARAGAPDQFGVFRFAGRNPGYLWLGRHDQLGWETLLLNVGCPSPEKVPASKKRRRSAPDDTFQRTIH